MDTRKYKDEWQDMQHKILRTEKEFGKMGASSMEKRSEIRTCGRSEQKDIQEKCIERTEQARGTEQESQGTTTAENLMPINDEYGNEAKQTGNGKYFFIYQMLKAIRQSIAHPLAKTRARQPIVGIHHAHNDQYITFENKRMNAWWRRSFGELVA